MNEELESKQAKLEWLAFRYVAGELDAVEAREFEQQLASDQTAREAVSAAAGLSLRLAATKPVEHVTLARPAGKSVQLARVIGAVSWASVGVAATVAVWAITQLTSTPPTVPPRGTNVPSAGKNDSDKIDAVAWVHLRSLRDASVSADRALDEWEPDEGTDIELDRSAALPAWVTEYATGKERKGRND